MLMKTGVPGYGGHPGIIAAISVCALGSLAFDRAGAVPCAALAPIHRR